eukprot:TRINITY_DN11098_c0_g1_i1.p1 TRINITY_DN11098_c0_g1~~TRINITY_DN11098_c0_g1_i1.p1  ORF type:complete len:767 (-),score=184.47 TRINITY_DN11098_c0_g1_i1:139-2439(-)
MTQQRASNRFSSAPTSSSPSSPFSMDEEEGGDAVQMTTLNLGLNTVDAGSGDGDGGEQDDDNNNNDDDELNGITINTPREGDSRLSTSSRLSGTEDDEDTFSVISARSPLSRDAKMELPLKERVKKAAKHYALVAGLGVILYTAFFALAIVLWRDKLTYEGWMAIIVTIAMVLCLFQDDIPAHLTMLIALAFLLMLRVITAQQSLIGFSNPSVAAIGVLLILTEAISGSGVLKYLARYMLGRPKKLVVGQIRLLLPTAILSAFVNNTPIVGIFIPIVQTWSRQQSFYASQLLMPLSFASILGGTCTIIGTSTNLIVVGLLKDTNDCDACNDFSVTFFSIGYVGFPVLVAGMIYLIFGARYLLPKEKDPGADLVANVREYTSAVVVTKPSPVIGKNIQQCGLRNLPGVYLFEIQRKNEVVPAPHPETVICEGDILLFTGVVSGMTEVTKIDGLMPAEADQLYKVGGSAHLRVLVEVVIAHHSPVVGHTVKECQFRRMYDAAIVAVSRHGERVNSKIGEITLRAGDTLLLETNPTFLKVHKNDDNFSLIGEAIDGSVLPKRGILNMVYVVGLSALAIAASQIQVPIGPGGEMEYIWSIWATGLFVALIFVATKRITLEQALDATKPTMLLLIASAFGVGEALNTSGAAVVVADSLLSVLVIVGPIGILAGLFAMTAILSAVISNAATVVLMFPVAIEFVNSGVISIESTIYTLMMGASAAFATPIGYQTNLMVAGPGGYAAKHFLKFGLPLCVIDMIITVTMCYFLYE